MISPQTTAQPSLTASWRLSLADLFTSVTAIAALCALWTGLFPPTLADGAIGFLVMNLLLTVPIPAATIAVARRVGWLRAWPVSAGASTLAFAVYFLAFNGHRGAQAHPWLKLVDALWLGLNLGTLTWAAVAGIVLAMSGLRRTAAWWRSTPPKELDPRGQ